MIAGGMAFGFHPVATAGERAHVADGPASFPIYDLHVHTSGRQNPQKILEKAREHNIQMFGIVDNVASTYGIQNDEELLYFINALKDLPCYIGLQPMEIGWSKRFTRELLDKIDYVIMDPQTVPDSNRYGDTAEVWEHDCYIPDAEEFMEVNMRYYMKVINNPEPLDIFGWPLFLPPAIARDYRDQRPGPHAPRRVHPEGQASGREVHLRFRHARPSHLPSRLLQANRVALRPDRGRFLHPGTQGEMSESTLIRPGGG